MADSLFEAAVRGMQILRKDVWFQEGVGAATRIEVEVREPATKQSVTLTQIERWLNGATISPNEQVRKERLRLILRGVMLR